MAPPRTRDDDESASDDSISLASTALSEVQDAYVIDGGILAERQVDDEVQYLVHWAGYDEHRNTWEPEENFQSGDTLKDWNAKKMRVTRGQEKPFDVNAWENRVQNILANIAKRKLRRRLKRKRLGLEVAQSSRSSAAQGSDSDVPLISLSPRHGTHTRSGSTAVSANSAEEESGKSRRQSLQPKLWTDQERRALEQGGSRAKGPYWNTILDMYGQSGTINEDLKYKNAQDLQRMAFEMKKEFLVLQREPPSWLQQVVSRRLENQWPAGCPNIEPMSPSGRSSRDNASEMSIHDGGSKERSRSTSPSTSRHPSPTKLLHRGSSYKGTARHETSISTPATPRTPVGVSSFNISALFGHKPTREKNRSETSDTFGPNPSKFTAAPDASESDSPNINKRTGRAEPLERAEPKRHRQTPRETISGPPRRKSMTKPVTEASGQPPLQMGIRGAGPARPKPARATSLLRPGIRKQSALKTAKDARLQKGASLKDTMNDIEPPKLFKNKSTQNRVFKKGRDEPAPNPDSLALLDPKTGRPPKPPPSITPVTQPSGETASARLQPADKRRLEKEESAKSSKQVPLDPPISKLVATAEKKARVLPPGEQQPLSAGPIDQLDHAMVMDDEPPLSAANTATASSSYNQGLQSFAPPTEPSLMRKNSRPLSHQNVPGIVLMRSSGRTAKIDLYNHTKTSREGSCLVKGNFKIGARPEDLFQIKLQGFERTLQQLLLTIKVPPTTVHFELKKTCLATEYQKFFPMDPSDFLGCGYVSAMPGHLEKVDSLAERLAKGLSGAFCFARLFTLIIYPVGAEAWAFLDHGLPDAPDGSVLRFIVRAPLPIKFADSEVPGLSKLIELEEPSCYKQVMADVSATTYDPTTKNINMIFQEAYGITYARLISDKKPIFFLIFVPAGCERYEKDPVKRHALRLKTSEEHDFVVSFLQENGAEVYSLQEIGSYEPVANGSWDYFVKNVKSGVLLIHDACIRVDQLLHLARFITERSINVWKISLDPLDEDARHSHLIRLFPHGAVILLTESLMLYRPSEALRILMWFRLFIDTGKSHKTPGTWKIAVRFRIRPWLLDIMDLYEDTGTDVFGCGKQVFGDLYMNINWLFEAELDHAPDGMHTLVWDDETPNEDAPLIAPASLQAMQERKEWTVEDSRVEIDHENIKFNDDLLVQWFAEWATVKCEEFRRFQAVLGYEPGALQDDAARRYKRWAHIEILDAETCYERNRISTQAELDAKESARLTNNREQASRLSKKSQLGGKKERRAEKHSLERTKDNVCQAGSTKKQIRDNARNQLKETEIDVDLDNAWNGRSKRGLANDPKKREELDALRAEERAAEERTEREDRERLAQGREKVMAWIGGDGAGAGEEETFAGEPMNMSDAADAGSEPGEAEPMDVSDAADARSESGEVCSSH